MLGASSLFQRMPADTPPAPPPPAPPPAATAAVAAPAGVHGADREAAAADLFLPELSGCAVAAVTRVVRAQGTSLESDWRAGEQERDRRAAALTATPAVAAAAAAATAPAVTRAGSTGAATAALSRMARTRIAAVARLPAATEQRAEHGSPRCVRACARRRLRRRLRHRCCRPRPRCRFSARAVSTGQPRAALGAARRGDPSEATDAEEVVLTGAALLVAALGRGALGVAVQERLRLGRERE